MPQAPSRGLGVLRVELIGSIQKFVSDFRQATTTIQAFGSAIGNAATKMSALNKAMRGRAAGIFGIGGASSAGGAAMRRGGLALTPQQLTGGITIAGLGASGATAGLGALNVQINQQVGAVRKANAAVTDASKLNKLWGAGIVNVTNMIRVLKREIVFFGGFFVLLGAISAVGKLISAFLAMDEQMARLRASFIRTGTAVKELASLQKFLAIETIRTGRSIQEVGDIIRELADAGLTLNEIMRATVAVNNLVIGSEASVESATLGLAKLYRTFGDQIRETNQGQDEFQVISDILTATLGESIGRMDDFTQAFKFATAAGKMAGFTFKDLSAILGTVIDASVAGGQAGRGLRQVFNQVVKDGDELAKQLGLVGETEEQLNRNLIEMGQRFGITSKEIEKMGVTIKDKFFGLLALAEEKIKETGQTSKVTGALLEEFGVRAGTIEAALILNIERLDEFRAMLDDPILVQGRGLEKTNARLRAQTATWKSVGNLISQFMMQLLGMEEGVTVINKLTTAVLILTGEFGILISLVQTLWGALKFGAGVVLGVFGLVVRLVSKMASLLSKDLGNAFEDVAQRMIRGAKLIKEEGYDLIVEGGQNVGKSFMFVGASVEMLGQKGKITTGQLADMGRNIVGLDVKMGQLTKTGQAMSMSLDSIALKANLSSIKMELFSRGVVQATEVTGVKFNKLTGTMIGTQKVMGEAVKALTSTMKQDLTIAFSGFSQAIARANKLSIDTSVAIRALGKFMLLLQKDVPVTAIQLDRFTQRLKDITAGLNSTTRSQKDSTTQTKGHLTAITDLNNVLQTKIKLSKDEADILEKNFDVQNRRANIERQLANILKGTPMSDAAKSAQKIRDSIDELNRFLIKQTQTVAKNKIEIDKLSNAYDKLSSIDAVTIRGLKKDDIAFKELQETLRDLGITISSPSEFSGALELLRKLMNLLREDTLNAEDAMKQVREAIDTFQLKLDKAPRIKVTLFDELKSDISMIENMVTALGQNMQRALSDTFFDVITGNFQDLRSVVASFAEATLRIITDMIARIVIANILAAVLPRGAGALGLQGSPFILGMLQKKQTGGFVPRPSIAEAGEFVVKKPVVNAVGLSALTRLNQGAGMGSDTNITNVTVISAVDTLSFADALKRNRASVSSVTTERIMSNDPLRRSIGNTRSGIRRAI